jgi:hypothetical protein
VQPVVADFMLAVQKLGTYDSDPVVHAGFGDLRFDGGDRNAVAQLVARAIEWKAKR